MLGDTLLGYVYGVWAKDLPRALLVGVDGAVSGDPASFVALTKLRGRGVLGRIRPWRGARGGSGILHSYVHPAGGPRGQP